MERLGPLSPPLRPWLLRLSRLPYLRDSLLLLRSSLLLLLLSLCLTGFQLSLRACLLLLSSVSGFKASLLRLRLLLCLRWTMLQLDPLDRRVPPALTRLTWLPP